MATLFSATLLGTNSSAANFRAWAKFIADTFLLGWLDNGDTGQIDLTAVAAPGAINTSMGYKMFKMNDALQATKPVVVKIEFGSGAASATTPAIWLTIATSSDGAGTLTGTILLARIQIIGFDSGATVQLNNYGSAAPNRITVGLWLTSSALFFGLERTKDATGADTNVGLILAFGTTLTGLVKSYYLPFASTLPAFQWGMHIILAETTPSALSGNVGVSPMIPMGYDAKQPGMNFIVSLSGDFAAFALVAINMYGAARNYQHLGANVSKLRNCGSDTATSVDTNTRLFIRYE